MKKIIFILLTSLLTTSGCSVKDVRQTVQYPSYIQKTKTIAVMPPDLYLHQITAGKQIELMDEWTDEAKESLSEALKENLSNRYGYDIKFIDEDWLKENHKALWKDYSSLYSTVAKTLMLHAMERGAHRFPTKESHFDYTLGRGVSELAQAVEADMLFFVYGEEYYSTKGKIASEIFVFTALAALSGGTVIAAPFTVPDIFYFSVVNGQTGQIEWIKSLSGGVLTRSFDDKKAISKVIKSIMEDMFPEN